jgi:hypothetical protein
MFWDDLVRRWRRAVGGLSPRLLQATAGHVAVLPGTKPRQRSRLPWLVLVALLLALVVLLVEVEQAHALLGPIAF